MKIVSDPLLLLAILLLGIWAVAALVLEGPGWVHGLLTIGVFLLIYRIVAHGTRDSAGR
jgi:putative effector of murein hydrolase LrgA (UPF0299 family)